MKNLITINRPTGWVETTYGSRSEGLKIIGLKKDGDEKELSRSHRHKRIRECVYFVSNLNAKLYFMYGLFHVNWNVWNV